jgi:hypothetical protein
MPRFALSNELKRAISMLPSKEKDKLLFRLIPKDYALVEQLEYKLLEQAESPDERRGELRQLIARKLASAAQTYYSPGYLLLDLRDISGDINRHVKTTKDKYGEIELNFLMLNGALDRLADAVRQADKGRALTFNTYVVARAGKLAGLVKKLHEDYRLDFKADMQRLAGFIKASRHMLAIAQNTQVDLHFLETGGSV